MPVGLSLLFRPTGISPDGSMIVRIDSAISLDRESLGPDLESALTSRLTRPNPEYEKRKRYGRWVGNQHRLLKFYDQTDHELRIPRGSLNLVRMVLDRYGVAPQWETNGVTTRTMGRVAVSDLDVTLREYQSICVDRMLDGVQGIVEMPCGAGKTTTAAAALLASGEPGLVLVHTSDILKQWVQTITALTAGTRPRVIQGKGSDVSPLKGGEVAVAMVQTLTRMKTSRGGKRYRRNQLIDLLDSVGALVTDEAHHVPAMQWKSIVDRCPARFRWGLTATPTRSDGLGFMLNMLMGPTLFKVSTDELIESQFLQRPTIIPVASGWGPSDAHYSYTVECQYCSAKNPTNPKRHATDGSSCAICNEYISHKVDADKGRLNYAKAVTGGACDAERTANICRLAKRASDGGRTTLILVPRKKAAYRLVRMLESMGVMAVAVTGDDNKSIRDRRLDDVRNGKTEVIIATQLADEGLDLPSLDCEINTSAGKDKGKARQRVGRTLRIGGKKPVVFEIVDSAEFKNQWQQRRKSYQQEYGNCVISVEPISVQDAIDEMEKVDCEVGQNLDRRLP